MANSASFEGVQSLSLLLWFTSTGGGSDRVIGGLHDSNSANTDRYGFLLNSRSSPMRAGTRLWDGLSEYGGLFTTPALDNRDGDWHFAVLTMATDIDDAANKRVRIYFDGAEALSSSIAGGGTLGLVPRHTSGADGVLTFGNDLGATNRALIGSIDEIAFIGRALTAGEVTDLWNAALTPLAQQGDFDGDGDVDGADFVAWQTNFPKSTGATLSEGDADGDGDVDGADFVVWQTNFPFTPSTGTAPVPEPGAAWLLLFGGIVIGATACHQRRQRLNCTVIAR
jgi:hypothetical protein